MSLRPKNAWRVRCGWPMALPLSVHAGRFRAPFLGAGRRRVETCCSRDPAPLILMAGVIGNTAKTWLAGSILLALEERKPHWRGLQHGLAFVVVAVILSARWLRSCSRPHLCRACKQRRCDSNSRPCLYPMPSVCWH